MLMGGKYNLSRNDSHIFAIYLAMGGLVRGAIPPWSEKADRIPRGGGHKQIGKKSAFWRTDKKNRERLAALTEIRHLCFGEGGKNQAGVRMRAKTAKFGKNSCIRKCRAKKSTKKTRG